MGHGMPTTHASQEALKATSCPGFSKLYDESHMSVDAVFFFEMDC